VLRLTNGYNSTTGFTYGGSIFGIGIALGKHLPLEANQTLKF